jgi:arsenate reductase-like glutaredoxin family protein
MAAKVTENDNIQDSIQVALDAADTAAEVTEVFHNLKEQFEVVNIQANKIYNSVLIIFVSAILAGLVSLGAASLMYYKALGTLKTNSNVSIEALAIFTENVAKLDDSVKLVKENTENQELIKATLVDLEATARSSVRCS